VVPAGEAGTYTIVLDSLSNVDTPYVHFAFGAPEMGLNTMAYGLPFLSISTNLGGGAAATDGLGLGGAQAPMNLAGSLLAPGYALDLAAEGAARLTLSVQTYPGLAALSSGISSGCARRSTPAIWRSPRRAGSTAASRTSRPTTRSSTISSPIRAPRS